MTGPLAGAVEVATAIATLPAAEASALVAAHARTDPVAAIVAQATLTWAMTRIAEERARHLFANPALLVLLAEAAARGEPVDPARLGFAPAPLFAAAGLAAAASTC